MKISIIISALNCEKYIEKCLLSCLSQTHKDFDVLVYDDASTDSTKTLIEQIENGHPEIKLYSDGFNRGPNVRHKTLIEQSNSPYIVLLDGDDYLDPNCLTAIDYVLSTHKDFGLVYTDHYEVNDADSALRIGDRCKIPYLNNMSMFLNFMAIHAIAFRKDVYLKTSGISEKYFYGHDYDLCLKLEEVTMVKHLPLPLYFYRQHPSSLTKNDLDNQSKMIQEIMQDALKRRKIDDKYKVSVFYENGEYLYKTELIHHLDQ